MTILNLYYETVSDVCDRSEREQRLARLAARVIRENGGVVIAEQLAPFVADPPELPPSFLTHAQQGQRQGPGLGGASTEEEEEEESAIVDESYVLPLAMRFNGAPSVTEQGHIIYEFQV